MAKFAYRCNRCRTRRMLSRRIENYKRAPKCHNCDHDRFYWDKERNMRRFLKRENETCRCSDYYPHPHRPGAKYCRLNPEQEKNLREVWRVDSRHTIRVPQSKDENFVPHPHFDTVFDEDLT